MRGLRQCGFSLIELSFVLLITGLLLQSSILPLSQLRDNTLRKQTQQQLQQIKQALIGHVIRTGALPCPIDVVGATAQVCGLSEGGVPAASLSLSGAINDHGALLDAWGQPIRYALSQSDHPRRGLVGSPDWSTPGEVAAIGIADVQAELRLCMAGVDSCEKKYLRADQLVAIVISDGSDATATGAQQENQDADSNYVLGAHSIVEGREFDDMLITLSRSDLAYWLLRSHWLTRPLVVQ